MNLDTMFPTWFALAVIWGTSLLSIAAYYGLHWLMTWRYRRRVERRLYTLRRVYWPLEEQGKLRRALNNLLARR